MDVIFRCLHTFGHLVSMKYHVVSIKCSLWLDCIFLEIQRWRILIILITTVYCTKRYVQCFAQDYI